MVCFFMLHLLWQLVVRVNGLMLSSVYIAMHTK